MNAFIILFYISFVTIRYDKYYPLCNAMAMAKKNGVLIYIIIISLFYFLINLLIDINC